MPLSAPETTTLRTDRQDIRFYLSNARLADLILWQAQVTGSPDREERTISFNSGSGDNWGWVERYQTIWVGTNPGGRDVGEVQIRSVASGDGGVTGTVTLEAHELIWQDGHWLTFYHYYEPWARFPWIAPNEDFFKFKDIPFPGIDAAMTPIPIGGPNRAGVLEGASLTFNVPAGKSYAIAPGATVVSRTVTVLPSTGVTVGAMVGDLVPITYTQVGQYWVKIEVTDSNGQSEITYRFHRVHSDDPNSGDYPIHEFESLELSGDYEQAGWRLGAKMKDRATLLEIPEKCLVTLWAIARYDGQVEKIGLEEVAKELAFSGYLDNDTTKQDKDKGGDADLEALTPNHILQNQLMYSISLASDPAPDAWWKHVDGMPIGIILHHIYKWHSTAIQTMDFIDLNQWTDLKRKYADIERATLYQMGDEMSRNTGIMAHLCSSKTGRMYLSRDAALLDDAGRAAVDTMAKLEEGDTTAPITIVRKPYRRTAFVFASGLQSYAGGDAVALGSTAPGHDPAPYGSRDTHVEKQIFADQTHANELSGQIYAVENNEYPKFTAIFNRNWLGVFDIVPQRWWTADVDFGDNVRGLVWVDQKLLPRAVNVSYNVPNNSLEMTVEFEPEVDGKPGVPYYWPGEVPDPGGGEEPEIPEEGVDTAALITTSSLHYLGNLSASWDLRTADDINHAQEDPWWRIDKGTNMPAQARIFTAENGRIRVTEDAGLSFSVLAPGDPPNDAGDAPAPALGDLEFVQVESDWTNSGKRIWLARWQNAADEWRSWLLYQQTSGFTWVGLGVGSSEDQYYLMNNAIFTGPSQRTRPYSIRELEPDVFVVFGSSGTSPNIKGIAVAGVVAGDVITPSNVVSSSVSHITSGAVGDVLSSSRVALVSPAGAGVVEIGVYNYAGNTLTLADVDTTSLTAENINAVVGLSATKFLIFYTVVNGANLDHRVVAVTVDSGGDNIALGAASTYYSHASTTLAAPVMPLKRSVSTAELYYSDGTDILGAMVSCPGDSAVVGATTQVITAMGGFATQLWADEVDGTRTLLGYKPTGATSGSMVIVENFSTLGTPVVYSSTTGHTKMQVSVKNLTEAAICYDSSTSGPCKWRKITIAGNSLSVGAEEDFPSIDLAPGILWLSGGALVGHMRESNALKGIVFGTGSADIQGLGVAVGKAAGSKVYATGYSVAIQTLLVFVYELPDLTLLGYGTLAENVSEAHVAARTWVAWPYCPWGTDDEVILYGRLNMASLGPQHTVYSDDGALSFIPAETEWGDDHCGAVSEDGLGLIYLSRNRPGLPPQIYYAAVNGPGILQGTSIVSGSLNPTCLVVDSEGNLILGSGVAGPIMVAFSPPPYTEWIDVTADHATDRGITSVIPI